MKNRTRKMIAFLCAVMMLATTLSSGLSLGDVNATDSAAEEVTPASLDGFTTISTSDFVDLNGNLMESKQYTSDSTFTLKELANFDKTLLTFKVNFEGTGHSTRIEFWGKDESAFFYVYPLSVSQLITGQVGEMVNGDPAWRLKIENTDISSTVNEEYLLQISTEYKDYNEDNQMDGVHLGLYLNGVQVNSVDLENCNMDHFGDRLTVRCGGAPMTIAGVETAEEDLKYVELEDYQTISVNDFVDSNGSVMKSQRHTSGHSYTLKELTGFDKTLLTFKVEFEELGTSSRIEFWGKDENAYFFVYPNSISQLYTGQVGTMTTEDAYWSLKTENTDIESTINQEYILQISTLYKDYDGDGINDGVQMGLYLNGVRVNKVDLKNCNMDNFGNRLTIRCDGAPVKVHHVETEKETEPYITLDGFRHVTLDAFSDSDGNPMESKTYTGYETFTMSEIEDFDRTLLTLKVKFESASVNSRIEFLGMDDNAFYFIYPSSEGQLLLAPNAMNTMNNMEDPYFSLKLENLENGEVTSTVNEEYILQISTEYLENNQVQMSVYLNGGHVRTMVLDSCNMEKFGNRLSIRCEEESPVTVSAVGTTDELNFTSVPGFQRVSVNDFVDGEGNPMESKTYTKNETFTLKERENFDKTLLTLKVKFEVADVNSRIEFFGIDETAFYFLYPSSESQLLLAPNAMNTMNNMEDPYFSLRLSNLQHKEVVSTINEEYILQISTEYKANDVVQVGVYLNGSLVRIFDIDSCNMDKFGNRLTVRCDETSPITISVVETEGNAHYDEEIDVRDLVAIKKAGEGLVMAGKMARLEADANGDGFVDEADMDIVRDRLLRTLPIYDEDVMPIAGFYGPYATYDTTGLYEFENRVNDRYFKLIADAGINLIAYSDLDYASKWYLNQRTLNLCDKYQIGYMVNDSTVLDYADGRILSDSDISTISAQIEKYSDNRAFYGMFLVDEPRTPGYHPVKNTTTTNEIDLYANLANVLKNNLNIRFSQSPLSIWAIKHPTYDVKAHYSDYLKEYCEKLYPDYLTWAYYPLEADPNDGIPAYFYNLSIMRDYAELHDIPLWSSIQAGGQFNDAKEFFNSESYFPTEAQFNWNVNTVLAFGAKGISYFPLVQPEHFAYALTEDGTQTMDFARNGLISAIGERNEWWYYARRMNQYISVIDEILMNAENQGIIVNAASEGTRLVEGSDEETYDVYSIHDDMSYVDDSYILAQGSDTQWSVQDVLLGLLGKEETSVSGQTSSWRELTDVTGETMIGCFDYNGKTALYVVNYDTDETLEPQEIGLQLNGEYNIKIYRQNNTYYETTSSLTLSMDAGEGVLLVLE